MLRENQFSLFWFPERLSTSWQENKGRLNKLRWIRNLQLKVVYLTHCYHFCLRPSAKDQGITLVVLLVLLVLHLLVHFLIKRYLREKNSPQPDPPSGTLPTELRRHSHLRDLKLSTYFKNHASDLGPVLVDTCLNCYVFTSNALNTSYCFNVGKLKFCVRPLWIFFWEFILISCNYKPTSS